MSRCGTSAGIYDHHQRKTRLCDECRPVYNELQQRWRTRRKLVPRPYTGSTWWLRAACAGTSTPDEQPWDLDGRYATNSVLIEARRLAALFCADCPVRTECLDDALRVPNVHELPTCTVRGGMYFTSRGEQLDMLRAVS